jgi:hypothetical protein
MVGTTVEQFKGDRKVMRFRIAAAALAATLAAGHPALADDISVELEQARAAYVRNDPLHALSALQATINLLNVRLAELFGKALPPAPAGWDAGSVESQSLDSIGGGVTVTRAYTKDNAALNAALIVDNPAVNGSVAMFQTGTQTPAQPGWSRLKVNDTDALLRYDSANRAGEILIVVGDRALLQIEGTDIGKDDILVETARGWNIPAIRKLLGP